MSDMLFIPPIRHAVHHACPLRWLPSMSATLFTSLSATLLTLHVRHAVYPYCPTRCLPSLSARLFTLPLRHAVIQPIRHAVYPLHIAGNTLDEVQSFKYLGAIISEEGSKPEVLARIAQATAALSSLKKIWRDRNITLRSKIRLLRSLVISIFLYACESWTLTADLQRRIQAMEMRCYRRLLNISYTEHITNVEVRIRIERAIGPYEDLLTTVKRRKQKWYGHVSRSSGLSKTIMQGTVKGGRRRGGQRKRWEDNIKDWTCLRAAESLRVSKDRNGWREVVRRSVMAPLRPPEVMG